MLALLSALLVKEDQSYTLELISLKFYLRERFYWEREHFSYALELYRAMLVRICNVRYSIAIAEYLEYAKSVSRITVLILLA